MYVIYFTKGFAGSVPAAPFSLHHPNPVAILCCF